MMGGTQRDVDEYGKNNGSEFEEENVLSQELLNYFFQKCKAVISIKDYKFTEQFIHNIRLKDREETTCKFDITDEYYGDWYECNSCGDTHIVLPKGYCPNCGKKLSTKSLNNN